MSQKTCQGMKWQLKNDLEEFTEDFSQNNADLIEGIITSCSELEGKTLPRLISKKQPCRIDYPLSVCYLPVYKYNIGTTEGW